MNWSTILAFSFCSLILALAACDSGMNPRTDASANMDAGAGTDASASMDVGVSECAGACPECLSAVEAACDTCPTDSDCDTPEDPCASAMRLQGMFGCTACAATAATAICDGT